MNMYIEYNTDHLYLLEATLAKVEFELVRTLQYNPHNDTARAALVDYLLEHDRPLSAEYVRRGFIPGVKR